MAKLAENFEKFSFAENGIAAVSTEAVRETRALEFATEIGGSTPRCDCDETGHCVCWIYH